MAHRHVLEREQTISRPREEVWEFFSDPRNLEEITPGFLRFRLEPGRPAEMIERGEVGYRLSLHGFPLRWRSRFEEVVPGRRFVDLQVRGPYRYWRHLHTFEDAPDGRTVVRDRVEYELPLGPLGDLAHALFVRRSLRRIFDHRRAAVTARLG